MRRALVVAAGLAIVGCTKEPGGGTSFGDPTVTASISASAGEGGTEESTDSGTDASTSSMATTTDQPESTTAVSSDDATTGMPPTTMPPTTFSDSSDDMGDGNGGQPQDGMYSHCLDANECSAPTNLCIQIQVDMVIQDGFCTVTGCSNPAVSCDPSPGGTATPICVGVMVNGMAEQACALDCSANKTCPMGMECWSLTGGLMLCA